MAPQRNRHAARFDVEFSYHVRLLEHAAQHQSAGQGLALDEAFKRRHRGHDVRRAGHAQLDAGRVLIARLLAQPLDAVHQLDRKSTRLNSSHDQISYAVFCLKKKKKKENIYINATNTTTTMKDTYAI